MIYLPFYHSWNELTTDLSNEDFGCLVRALLEYDLNGTETSDLSPAANIAYKFMIETIRRSHIKAESGKKGSEKRWGNKFANSKPIATSKQTDSKPIAYKLEVISNKLDIKKENTKEKNPLAERFALFWSVYPKKVGKGAAEKAFVKLRPSEELTQLMIEAIGRAKLSAEWTRDNGQYIPNPATWLNQKRWEDELTDATEVKPISQQTAYCAFDANAAMQRAIARSLGKEKLNEGNL